MEITIQDITLDTLHEIVSWQYDDDYAMYNINVDDLQAEYDYWQENHYYAIVDENDRVVGHCVYYDEARVPGGDYSLDALDIGIGMHPDWTGQGNGTAITKAVMEFGRQCYQPTHFRATIAAWNKRAQKVCRNNGFAEVSRFTATNFGNEFVILQREA